MTTASRWDEAQCERFAGKLGSLVYASRLLGGDGTLALHGGGNTSVKLRESWMLHGDLDVLYVKASGYDLARIDERGFSALALAPLRSLVELENVTDEEWARGLRASTLDPDHPPASVETLLHAVVPEPYVDHTHAQPILALTNTPSGVEHIRRALGDSVVVVPYVRPGHALARLAAELMARQRTGATVGLVLAHHGLVTFGASAREAYERTISLVARAEAYLEACGAAAPRADPGSATPAETSAALSTAGSSERPDGVELARLRSDISRAAGCPMILRSDDDPAGLSFARRADLTRLSQSGPATPDHVIRTKRLPLLGRDVDAYAAAYRAYFEQHAAGSGAMSVSMPVPMPMLDPAPRVILDPQLGLCTAGRSAAHAEVAAELYRQTIDLILRADALEQYEALPASEIFEVEYWPLELAKLRGRPEGEFAGEVAVVTGAASGIGRACVESLLERDASVCGLDIAPEVARAADTPGYVGLACDVTDEAAVTAALQTCARRFGGIDMLVLCAGAFPPSRRVAELDLGLWRRTFALNADANLAMMRDAYPFLTLAPRGGRVVLVASKNVPAPGPGAAAYSASKAALTQLARVAALEWGSTGIRVNVVHPDAVFDTGLWTEETIAARASQYGLTPDQYRTRNVLGKEVASRDVAELVAAMCGRAFAKTTGAQVPIDGGNERVI